MLRLVCFSYIAIPQSIYCSSADRSACRAFAQIEEDHKISARYPLFAVFAQW